jgi:hypothetical protein
MPIELICKSCAQKLRVAESDAGKSARCPKCRAVFTVPAASESRWSSADETDFASLPDQYSTNFAAPSPDQYQWYLKADDGRSYGPVSKAVLDSWVAEGRVTEQSQLRQENNSQWQDASRIYPQLRMAGPRLSTKNPFAGDSAGYQSNPYMSPGAAAGYGPVGYGPTRYMQPHRGGLVLALGLLGIFFCSVLCIAAWIMGATDLREIRAGRMDQGGYGLTMAGMIIGIIGTALTALFVVVAVLGGF